jgi:hypothetical protein
MLITTQDEAVEIIEEAYEQDSECRAEYGMSLTAEGYDASEWMVTYEAEPVEARSHVRAARHFLALNGYDQPFADVVS